MKQRRKGWRASQEMEHKRIQPGERQGLWRKEEEDKLDRGQLVGKERIRLSESKGARNTGLGKKGVPGRVWEAEPHAQR